MKLLNCLVFSFLCAPLLIQGVAGDLPCKEISATVETKPATAGNNGSIIVTIDNPRQFRLNLIAPKAGDNRLDLPVEEIKNLSPGNYELVITENKEGDYCPKHLKVAVE